MNQPAVSLSRLEGFYWVAKTEGYARAARAFPYPITQPGVHQQVRRLEEELGVKLFVRTGKDRVTLTVPGRALFDYVAPFYERLPGLVAQLRSGRVGGKLKIHAAGLILRHLLPPWLRALQAARPDIEIQLTEMKEPDVSLLRSGEADLLVDHFPDLPNDVEGKRVATARAYLALPSSHRLAERKRVSLSELSGDNFVAYNADRRSRALQLHFLAEQGSDARPTHSADSADAILGFVAAGIGFSVVPALGDEPPAVPGVKFFPLPQEYSAPIHAAFRKSPVKNPLVEAMLGLAPPAEGARR